MGLCVQAKRAQLALAYGRPWAPPPAPPDHRTYLCQEAAWLAVDFAQARAIAMLHASRAQGLNFTP